MQKLRSFTLLPLECLLSTINLQFLVLLHKEELGSVPCFRVPPSLFKKKNFAVVLTDLCLCCNIRTKYWNCTFNIVNIIAIALYWLKPIYCKWISFGLLRRQVMDVVAVYVNSQQPAKPQPQHLTKLLQQTPHILPHFLKQWFTPARPGFYLLRERELAAAGDKVIF